MEAVHRQVDHLATTIAQRGGQLGGKGRLSRRGDAVDRGAHRVSGVLGGEMVGDPPDHLAPHRCHDAVSAGTISSNSS